LHEAGFTKYGYLSLKPGFMLYTLRPFRWLTSKLGTWGSGYPTTIRDTEMHPSLSIYSITGIWQNLEKHLNLCLKTENNAILNFKERDFLPVLKVLGFRLVNLMKTKQWILLGEVETGRNSKKQILSKGMQLWLIMFLQKRES
jgi:hypothetical protein